MSNRLVCRLVSAAFIAASCGAAAADDEAVKFKGYSPGAQMTVDKFLHAVGKLKTYSDEAVIKMETGMSFGQDDQSVSFIYAKPRRFRIRTQQHDITSNGKELTVHLKGMRRYTVSPLEEDVGKQVSSYIGGRAMNFGIGQLILAKNARKKFAEQFEGLESAGSEHIDGDRCTLLSGTMSMSAMGMSDENTPATLYIRESDMMLRRVEVDLIDLIKKQFEGEEGMVMPFKEYKIAYDVREIRVNEKLDEDLLTFEPPAGSKKVERFYTMDSQPTGGAMQFEMSGKQAPEFELETTDGEWVSLESLSDKVIVLDFLPRWRMNRTSGLEQLDEIRGEYADKDVSIVCVHGKAEGGDLTEELEEKGLKLTIALDAGGSTLGRYFEERFGSGIVLISKDGIVQGRYSSSLDEDASKSLRADIDTLLAGKTLGSAGEMTEEQIDEAAEQRGARYSQGEVAEALNEDRLREAWSVRAARGQSFSFGSSGASPGTGGDFWLRDKDVIKRVNTRGETTAEIPLPESSFDQFSRDQFVAGKIGTRLGVVYMKSVAGEGEEMGYRPPKQFLMIAGDESGETLWKLEFDVSNFQMPGQLTLADIDGRPGGEVLFVHQGALWIVDARGEPIVRKPVPGIVQWMIVDDRDRDGRPELYVRSNAKLVRLDYRP